MRSFSDHALLVRGATELAQTGVPVFPCLANKRPACAGGFKAATTDSATLGRLFSWVNGAALIGVPTGRISGIDVLDLDWRHTDGGGRGARTWWEENRHRLPASRVHRTRRGGLHVVFRHAEGVRNTQGKIGKGIDTRATGGYVVWWPAAGFPVLCEAEPALWPAWLLESLLVPKPKPKAASDQEREPARPDDQLGRLIHATIRNSIERVRGASEGQRHYVLLRAARVIGGCIDRSHWGEKQAIAGLVSAAEDAGGVDLELAARTAKAGIEHGRQSPLRFRPPERRP